MDFLKKYGIVAVAKKRRCLQQAIAFTKRGLDAGIPEQYLVPCIFNEEYFASLLSPHHYDEEGAKMVVESIYRRPNNLFKIPFILISGGNIATRKKAGFAILFRLISCDRFGSYRKCSELSNKLQIINSTEIMNRNDIVNELKGYGVLFISEFHMRLFNPHFDTGNFFDEVLGHRADQLKPTIISFSSSEKITDSRCGQYLAELAAEDQSSFKTTSEDVIKIKVGLKA